MPDRFPALDAMIREIESIAKPDAATAVTEAICLALANGENPYRLLGALIEGIATVVVEGAPAEARCQTMIETMQLLRDEFRQRGVI